MAVTRADVARRAGVSPAVVSYVLRPGLRPVAEATRRRVLAAVEELGYRPNAVAQALRGGPTRSLGLLVPDHANPFFAELSHEIEELAFADGYVLLMGSTMDDPAREATYLRTFADRKVDGILVVATRSHPELAAVRRSGVPVVLLDRAPAGPGPSTVVVDGREGIAEAVRHLADRGHADIGCVAGPAGLAVAEDRLQGWREGMERADLTPDDRLVARSPFSRSGGRAATTELLGRPRPPTALLVCSDVQAVGAMAAAADDGRRVPEDLALIGFDGTELSRHSTPPLTVVQQPVRELASLAVERLLGMASDPEAEATHDVLGTRLVVRASSGAGPR